MLRSSVQPILNRRTLLQISIIASLPPCVCSRKLRRGGGAPFVYLSAERGGFPGRFRFFFEGTSAGSSLEIVVACLRAKGRARPAPSFSRKSAPLPRDSPLSVRARFPRTRVSLFFFLFFFIILSGDRENTREGRRERKRGRERK